MTPHSYGRPGTCYEPGLLANEVDADTVPGVREVATSPERNLVAAILQQALDDARGRVIGETTRAQQRHVKAEAKWWLANTTAGNAFGGATWSLAFVCEVLARDPATATQRARKQKRGARRYARYERRSIRVVAKRGQRPSRAKSKVGWRAA